MQVAADLPKLLLAENLDVIVLVRKTLDSTQALGSALRQHNIFRLKMSD